MNPKNFLSDLTFPRVYDIVIALMGPIVLLVTGVQFWRSHSDFHGLALIAVALGAIVIGISYYNYRSALHRLEGSVDQRVISRLFQAGNSMALFAYLICECALVFGVHRH